LLDIACEAAKPEAGENQRGGGCAGEPHQQWDRQPEPGGDGGARGKDAANIVIDGIGPRTLQTFLQEVFDGTFAVLEGGGANFFTGEARGTGIGRALPAQGTPAVGADADCFEIVPHTFHGALIVPGKEEMSKSKFGGMAVGQKMQPASGDWKPAYASDRLSV
jgi:hypothetical protein